MPAKNQGDKRSHFQVNNSLMVLPFLLILMLHEYQCCGFALDTRWVHMRKTYIEKCCFSSWPETSCLYVQSSLRTDLWWWILGWIPHCWSVEGGVLPQHPCRFCLAEMWEGSGCHHVLLISATKPVFLLDRAWLTVNRSPQAQWPGKSASCRF